MTLPKKAGDSSDTVKFPVRVKRARWERNDHTRADELDLDLDWQDTGMDPRILSTGIVAFYLGNADEFDEWVGDDSNLRFVGMVTKAKRKGSDSPLEVQVSCLDYTTFFIRAKKFAAKGIPEYSQTLEEAWRTIIGGFDGPSGENVVANLKDALEFRGLSAPGPVISAAITKRFEGKGQIACKPGCDAWAVWQQCVGMVGLISFFDRNKVVVTTTDAYYSAKDPPLFTWGVDLLSFEEERNNEFERRGIGVTSFSHETGKALEAVWPPDGEDGATGKRVSPEPGKEGHASKKSKKQEQRDYFSFPGITEQAELEKLAKRVYEERSRQEMQGSVETREMVATTEGGAEFDLLSLQAGDVIKLKLDIIDTHGRYLQQEVPNVEDRVAYLVERGYDEGAARVMAENLDAIVKTRQDFYVKSVAVDLDVDLDAPDFSLRIEYCNRIQGTGDATAT